MKIAVLHPYPPSIGNQIPRLPGKATQGGGETSSYFTALEYSKKGHEVSFYTGKYKGISVNELKINKNFKVIYLNSFFKNLSLAMPYKLFFKLLIGNYDVIHSQQIPIMYSVIAAIAAKLNNKKFIMTFHGRLPFCLVDEMFGRFASYFSESVMVQSKFSYNLVSKFVDKRKIIIMPHGINTNLYYKRKLKKTFIKKYKQNHEKIILFVGRLISPKGIDVLLRAFALLSNKYRIKLLIIGEGVLKEELKELATELSISEKVVFIGHIEQDMLPEFYSLADIFVLPSTNYDSKGNFIRNVSENFGLVLAEAMCCNVPVIASDMGGISDWVKDNYNGLLFQERNAVDLSRNIEKYLNNNKLRKKIITNALNEIRDKYSWEANIEKLENLIKTI
jgi:glycosyltransferase involved in cell wall biosynthesis